MVLGCRHALGQVCQRAMTEVVSRGWTPQTDKSSLPVSCFPQCARRTSAFRSSKTSRQDSTPALAEQQVVLPVSSSVPTSETLIPRRSSHHPYLRPPATPKTFRIAALSPVVHIRKRQIVGGLADTVRSHCTAAESHLCSLIFSFIKRSTSLTMSSKSL